MEQVQMPEVLERYYAYPPLFAEVLPIIKTNFSKRAKTLKETWPTLSKGTQENIMKLAIILSTGPRKDWVTVEGIGIVYTSGNLRAYIVPKEPDHADA